MQPQAPTIIDVHELTRVYGPHVAIDKISFQVMRGEIVGFLGPNGAGKSTTLKILAGLLPCTAGSARVADCDLVDAPRQVKNRVGYLPEVAPLYPDLTVREYLHFVAALKRLRGPSRRRAIDHVVERVGLMPVMHRLIGNLSKGYGQRVGLAQALLGSPEVLILDEPTVGLDPRQIGEVRALIRSLAGEHTVILSTHILHEVTQTCQRAIIINKGRIVADDPITHLVARHRRAGREPSLEEIFLSLTEV